MKNHPNRVSPTQNHYFWVKIDQKCPKMPFLGQNGTFWPNLARSDEILGISKSGWCQRIKCASWTPETDSRGIWMIWNGFLGLLASGTQKVDFGGNNRARIKTDNSSVIRFFYPCYEVFYFYNHRPSFYDQFYYGFY